MKIRSTILATASFFFIFGLTACTPQPFNINSDDFFKETEQQTDQISEDINKHIDDQLNSQIEEDLFGGTLDMKPEDCIEFEKYDPVDKVCYFECNSDEQCAQFEEEISAALNEIGNDFFEGSVDFEEAQPTSIPSQSGDAQVPPQVEGQKQTGEESLIEYTVSGDDISNPIKGKAFSDKTKKFQEDFEKHQGMWNYFVKLFPKEFRSQVVRFTVFTDGKEGTYGAVYQDESDPTKWVLAMDIADAYNGNNFNQKELPYTLIHEFGHLLTLNETQIDIAPFFFEIAPGQTEEGILAERERNCAPKLYIQEGCTKGKSTINSFYQNYWKDISEEKAAIETIENDDEYAQKTGEFYTKYRDRFVTDYAATNVGEDIAESFTAFVLKQKPENPQTIADQKIAFFYEYETLVKLQQYIRMRLQ